MSWTAAAHGTGYAVYESKTSGSYTITATVTTSSWTSGALAAGRYTFEVATSIGTNWSSVKSSKTTTRTIAATRCR